MQEVAWYNGRQVHCPGKQVRHSWPGMQTDAKRHRDLQETKCWGEEGDLDFHEDMISVDSRGQMAALWLGSIEGWPSLALGRAAYGSSSRPCGVCWLLSTCL